MTTVAWAHAQSAAPARPTPLRRYAWITLVAATSTVVGVIWDISWHRSIGRDTFWTPAHLAIYLGGVLAGGSSGWLVLRTTFSRSPDERAAGVRFWGFRGPFGAWLCVWGALAMVTSAPLDNWWHNAYGLDVKVLSPPHTLLALGMWSIQLGALLLAAAVQNEAASDRARRAAGLMVAYLAGLLLENAAILGIEQVGFANAGHNALYYEFAAGVFPVVLLAAGRGARLAWPATTAAATYMMTSLIMIWVLQLFPATPKLAPVFNPLTHMVPAPFPVLLVAPAVVIDLLIRRLPGRDWLLAGLAGVAFVGVLLAVQWVFTAFLLSPAARTFAFGVDHWDYSSRLGPWRYQFWRTRTDPLTPRALGVAVLLAVASARLGVWAGTWTAQIRR
jgi:hypothetical protein